MNRVSFRALAAACSVPVSQVAACGFVVLPTLVLPLVAAKTARADVVGRLHFAVKNAADEKPIVGARVVLKDSARVRPDVVLTTSADGTVTTGPLENRAWNVTVSAEQFQNDTRDVTVVADTTTEVEVLLEPLQEKVVRITGARDLVRPTQTDNGTRRDVTFARKNPITAGNTQSLSKLLRSTPGFVENSVNQVHPRGEHSSTAIYINGFLLPGALQGRAGQIIAPDAIQTLDVLTGGYAPEYGGETAAALNLTLRAGTVRPFQEATLGGGGYSTFQGTVTTGGQAGAPLGAPTGDGLQPKRIGYLLNVTQRNTNNAVEPPQPGNQTAHNGQTSTTVFGNFDYRLDDRDTLTFLINTAPARTEIANRTGLPSQFASYGQGYGYAGALSAEDAAAQGIRSQEADRQDIYQRDNNTFAVLEYRKSFSPTTTGLFSVGYTVSRLDVLNNNPGINLFALPGDSSIEFSPTIKRDYNQAQVQANVTISRNKHTVKLGALYTDQNGKEDYRLVPGSLTALTALYNTDPRLAPSVLTGEDGQAVLDANNQVQLAPGATTPNLHVTRDGYYAAAYAQDTFRATPRFVVNYGVRLDSYRQTQNLGQSSVQDTELSPRVNTAYTIARGTVARASYNRLFTQPPLAQGSILGQSIKPQKADMYEGGIERQFGSNQTAKATYYQKEFRNQLDTGLLLEGTQIGVYTTVNLQKATVKGFELSYDLSPRNNVGLGGFLAWANATAKPRGVDNTGEPIEDNYNDHDQLNTISTGANYTLVNGANAGVTFVYNSGNPTSDYNGDGKRVERTEVNLQISSGSRVIGRGLGLEFQVQNLFDQRRVINFQSPFSGTRFQQGRRLLLSATGRF